MPECNETKIKFYDEPLSLVWIDGEVTLFDETIYLHCKKNVQIDSTIVSELIGRGYNTFRLYINNEVVSTAGFSSDPAVLASTLQTVELIYGRTFCNRRKIRVRLTAQVTSLNGLAVSSNVNNLIGNYLGTKGADLRIILS